MCAKILEARVKQKKDTLENWEANDLVLLDGEQAFVVNGDGQPINFKIGDGTKRFSELPWWIQYDGGQYIQITGNVLPEPTVDVGYSLVGPGTYTFAGQADVVAPEGRLSQLLWNGTTWSLVDMGELPTVPVSNVVSQRDDIAISPKGVDDALNKFINPSNQLFNKEEAVMGYFKEDGTTITSTTTIRSGLIDLDPTQTQITISPSFWITAIIVDKVVFFNSVGEIAGKVNNETVAEGTPVLTFAIPTNAVRMGINIATNPSSRPPVTDPKDNDYVNGFMVSYGTLQLPWEPYGEQIKDSSLKSTNEKIEAIDNELQSISFDSPNIFNKNTVSFGYWNDSGDRVSSTTTIASQMIPILEGKTHISINQSANLAPTITYRLFFLDNEGHKIGVPKTENLQGIEIPKNSGVFGEAKFIVLNITSQSVGLITNPTDNEWVNSLQVEYGLESTPFRPFGKLIDGSKVVDDTDNYPTGVSMEIIDERNFIINSRHSNGETVRHTWIKNNRIIEPGQPPHLDNSWQANFIRHNGQNVVQGSFNAIHVVNLPNENTQHVGTGHGAEELLRARFFVDGKEIIIEDNIGNTFTGEEFSFDILNRIYAVDAAATTNGSDVVIQLDENEQPIPSTLHSMQGKIKGNSLTEFNNKLVALRNIPGFVTCYLGMHNTYPSHWDDIQVMNAENTINNIQNLTPISPSTTHIGGYTYDIPGGGRGELGNEIVSYSNRFGYVFKSHAWCKDNDLTKKITIYVNPTSKKAYIQPLITTEVASARGLPVDSFQEGDIIFDGYVTRQLFLS